MFKIGDRVRVINTGKQYCSYIKFIEKYCPRAKANKFERGYSCKQGDTALVIGYGEHLTRDGIPKIYILEYDNHVVIIEEPGLELVRPATQKSIRIYANDLTTTAVIKENGKVIKTATAKCNTSDTYDFETGAKLAFERLLGSEVKEVKEVKRPAKVGEYIKIVDSNDSFNDYKNGDILLVVKADEDKKSLFATNPAFYKNERFKYASLHEYVVLENYIPDEPKAEFKAHLKSNYTGSEDGFIGEETVQVDLVGNKLCVGDTVTLYNGPKTCGEYSICKVEEYPQGFVMDVASHIFKDGKSMPYSIIKNRSYAEIPNGEIVGGIKYIKEEN